MQNELSEKELDICQAIRNGSTNEDIASSFGVDADTIARLRGVVDAEKPSEGNDEGAGVAPAENADTTATPEGGENTPADGEQTPA